MKLTRTLLIGAAVLPFLGALAYADFGGLRKIGYSVVNPLYSALVANSGQVSTSNPLPTMAAGGFTVAFSTTSNGDVTLGTSTIVDMLLNGDLSEADVYLGVMATGATITFYGSNDQTNWLPYSEQRNDSLWVYASGINYAGNQWTVPIKFRYFKMSVAGSWSGSVSGSVSFKTKSASLPTGAILAQGSVSLPAFVSQPDLSVPINISSASAVAVIAPVTGRAIYITDIDLMAGGSTNVTFEYGTQTTTPCDTGATPLSGAYPLATGSRISHGSGLGQFLTIPIGKQFCILNSAAVQLSGFIGYAQR